MSGAHAKWTPERRAAQAERMRRNNYDAEFVGKRNAGMKSEFNRVRKAAAMRKLIKARQEDATLNAKWRAAISAANLRPERLAALRKQMDSIHRYWRQEWDTPHMIEMRTTRSRRASASRRGLDIPQDLMPTYEQIRRKVGMREAVRIISDEMRKLAA